MTPIFPSVIDSSMIEAWRKCKRMAKLQYFDHWVPRTPSVHLHAGAAYARGCEVARQAFYDDGTSEETAIAKGLGALLEAYGDFDCPPDSPKSAARMAGAFEYMMSTYPLPSTESRRPLRLPSGKHAIEFSFLEPLHYTHPVSGDPILFSGRFDMITEYAGLFGFDDKTTTSLGASWARSWDLRAQFTAYCWGAQKSGIPLEGFIIRGISILKTKYDTQEAITYRPQWMVEEWYESVLADLKDMESAWRSGDWFPNHGDSCNAYGGCMYRRPCLSSDRLPWLEQGFTRMRWDPIARERIPVEMEV